MVPARARAAAVRAVERARAGAGLPDWPLAGVDVLQTEGAVPSLVGTPEIARMLGVRPERVREPVATHEHFPRPVGQLGRAKVWNPCRGGPRRGPAGRAGPARRPPNSMREVANS